MKKVVVSAPGKIHLSGEHAVVHGKPAVLVSTSKRMYVTIEKIQNSKFKIQNDISKIKKEKSYLAHIIHLVEKKYATVFKDFSVAIHSDIPTGAGMGSSAALAVATNGALSQWVGKPWNPTEINELAFQAEKHQHGNPSGGDNTVVTHGGILWYRKELDFLKTFWLLPFKIPTRFSQFVLINTGRFETTKDLVAIVDKKRKTHKDAFILLMSRIEDVTRQMVQAIHDENKTLFGEMVTQNERLLEEMGVVSTLTKKLIDDIENSGGVAKISGAGGIQQGSGMVVAMHEDPGVLIDIAKKYKFSSFQTVLGGEGVRIEQVLI